RPFLWLVGHSSSAVPGTGRRDGRVSNGPPGGGAARERRPARLRQTAAMGSRHGRPGPQEEHHRGDRNPQQPDEHREAKIASEIARINDAMATPLPASTMYDASPAPWMRPL